MNVHYFDTSGEAYDASQTQDDIQDGDVLVVESEKAVAILIQAWPTIYNDDALPNEFHEMADGYTWEADFPQYAASVKAAERILAGEGGGTGRTAPSTGPGTALSPTGHTGGTDVPAPREFPLRTAPVPAGAFGCNPDESCGAEDELLAQRALHEMNVYDG